MKVTKGKTPAKGKRASEVRIRGTRIPAFGNDYVVIRTVRSSSLSKRIKAKNGGSFLIKKAGEALTTPGISRNAIFKKKHSRVFAYSVDPSDPKRIVRHSDAGKRTVGRFVDGRFRSN